MNEIEQYKVITVWRKPTEKEEYMIYARSESDADEIARKHFANSHTEGCEIVSVSANATKG